MLFLKKFLHDCDEEENIQDSEYAIDRRMITKLLKMSLYFPSKYPWRLLQLVNRDSGLCTDQTSCHSMEQGGWMCVQMTWKLLYFKWELDKTFTNKWRSTTV